MSRRSITVALIACGIAMAVGPAGAHAAETGQIQAVLTEDGTGSMTANSGTNPPWETWSWEVCAPDLSLCAPFATGRSVTTHGAPAITRFRATSNLGATALSPVWFGDARSLGNPDVDGKVRANELVTPVLGTWAGGWEGGVHFTQLAACSSQAAKRCTVIADRGYSEECPNGGAVIDRAFVGDYLRVADRMYGPDPVFPSIAIAQYFSELAPASRATSVAVVGRIRAPTRPRSATCGPREHVPVKIDRDGFANAVCLRPCTLTLSASGDGEELERKVDLSRLERIRIRFRPRTLIRLEGRRVRLTAEIDGELEAQRVLRPRAR